MARRIERLTAQLQREIGVIVTQELNDPRLGFVTITEVKVSDDMQFATVFASIIGDDGAQTRTLRALKHARGHIQSLLGERLKLRWTPRITFQRDDGVKKSVRLSALLRDLAREREEQEGQRAPAGEEHDQTETEPDTDPIL